MSTVNVAIVGLGKMGIVHAALLAAMPNVRVAGMCDANRLLTRYARRFLPDVPVVEEVSELSGLDLDAVFVTTPVTSHFDVVSRVLGFRRQPHIFVEKPLGRTSSQSNRMLESVQSVGARLLVTMVGYNRRYSVTFRQAKRMLEGGAVGEPSEFLAYAFSSDFVGYTRGRRGRLLLGDALRDLGCHALDLIFWFFGDMKVESVQHPVEEVQGVEAVRIMVKTGAGVGGRCDVSREVPAFRLPEVGLTVVGFQGTLRVTDDELQLMLGTGRPRVWYRHDLGDTVPFLLADPSYFREDESFVKGILDGHQVEPDFLAAAQIDHVISEVEGMLSASKTV